MSSNIRIAKVCEYRKQEFIAKTIQTRYCSHSYNNKAYKESKRNEKIDVATNPRQPFSHSNFKLNKHGLL